LREAMEVQGISVRPKLAAHLPSWNCRFMCTLGCSMLRNHPEQPRGRQGPPSGLILPAPQHLFFLLARTALLSGPPPVPLKAFLLSLSLAAVSGNGCLCHSLQLAPPHWPQPAVCEVHGVPHQRQWGCCQVSSERARSCCAWLFTREAPAHTFSLSPPHLALPLIQKFLGVQLGHCEAPEPSVSFPDSPSA
jgi:hypothetical protein